MQKVQPQNKKYTLKRSKGEQHISRILKGKGLEHYIEYSLRTLRYRRFDFYIPSKKLLIEYDGYQHFEYPNKYHKSISEWKKCNRIDKKKQKHALSRGYRIARIDDNTYIEYHLQRCMYLDCKVYLSNPEKYENVGIKSKDQPEEDPQASVVDATTMNKRQQEYFVEVCNIVEEFRGIIKTEYTRLKDPMTILCMNYHEFSASLCQLRQGKWCGECRDVIGFRMTDNTGTFYSELASDTYSLSLTILLVSQTKIIQYTE